MLNLKPEDLACIKSILSKWVPQAEVWAYGSRITAYSHDASDLDLVVRNPENLEIPTDNFLPLKQAFRDSNLPILVDVLDWANLPAGFKEEIIKQHIVIAKSPTSRD